MSSQPKWFKSLFSFIAIVVFAAVAFKSVSSGVDRRPVRHMPYEKISVNVDPWDLKKVLTVSYPVLVKDPRKSRHYPTAYLTFDDGPSITVTPKLLDILEAKGIRGTFFVIGNRVGWRSSIVRRAYQMGNTIGDHTYDHVFSHLYHSPSQYLRSLELCNKAIIKATGSGTRLNRPPGGAFRWLRRKGIVTAINKGGYRIYNWNVESGDGKGYPTPGKMFTNVISQTKAKRGKDVIILFHDTKPNVLKALPHIIEKLDEMGYVFEPLTPSVKQKIAS